MYRKFLNFRILDFICLITLIIYFSFSIYMNPYYKAQSAVAYYYGQRGDMIYNVQVKLKNWGYYSGNTDGIFGYKTYQAVKKFQAYNGLTADGIIGNKTLQSLGINAGGVSSGGTNLPNNQDLSLLARLINGEARGEPYEGQVAVGAVIMNRTRDSRFPSTIAGVIYQPGAFTAIVDGQINANLEKNSVNAARDALNGWDPSGGALYYFNPATATSSWIWSRPLIKVIGKHRFCK